MQPDQELRLSDFASCAGCASKLPPTSISQLLGFIPPTHDPNLLVGTETHDDAGVYRIAPDLALVQTVDFFPPVVDDPFVYGQIAAANALSDVYAMGGVPATALNLVAYPDDKIGPEWLGRILAGGAERCRAATCTIVGGHTIRDAVIKFGMAVTGTIHPDRVVTNAGARPGDVLVLTKPLGVGFVTTAAKKRGCPPDLLAAAYASMVRLNKDACTAMLAVGVSAATDVTGFGLAGHGFEMADGSKVTLRLRLAALPLLPGIEQIDVVTYRTRASKTNREYTESQTRFEGTPDAYRREFLYDPQTSGGLLISVPAARAAALVGRLKESGELAAAVIGEVTEQDGAALVVTG
ncbi:selenide, water dikinase SelD [Fimbriiglobus ruber]|uniref:Selenide, water dikinase n=1 Tax=Fimbriiglobus ruber TaxID=1908690 RepID=A0A225DKZ2_9BACT|nr:selenide, water dikinase SelD [Fimbriiglobus ruber]OWK41633.1 Selenide,water dikinase [Fimbriiglobus ruber]